MDTLSQAKACCDAASALSDGTPPVDIDIPIGPIPRHDEGPVDRPARTGNTA
jgi:hypothetical protein